MESDKRLSIYQNNLIQASNLFGKYPDGIIIGGLLAIKIGSNYLPFEHFVQKSIANFFICIWAICIFPIFIKMIQKKAYSEL